MAVHNVITWTGSRIPQQESKKSEKVKMVVYGNKPVLDTREHAVCFVVVSKDFGVDLEL